MQEPQFPPQRFVQREFFVPGTETVNEAQEQWRALATELAVHPSTDRRVQRLVFTSNREEYTAEVGYLIGDGVNQWLVAAIFEPDGMSLNDPWTLFLLRIRNGKVVTRRPAWQVSQSTVVEALNFIEPVLQPGNGHGNAISDSGNSSITSESDKTEHSLSHGPETEAAKDEISPLAPETNLRAEHSEDSRIVPDQAVKRSESSTTKSDD